MHGNAGSKTFRHITKSFVCRPVTVYHPQNHPQCTHSVAHNFLVHTYSFMFGMCSVLLGCTQRFCPRRYREDFPLLGFWSRVAHRWVGGGFSHLGFKAAQLARRWAANRDCVRVDLNGTGWTGQQFTVGGEHVVS